MRTTNYHLNIGYEVWKGPDAWLWLVISPYRNSGTIGVAGSQNQAARDACLAIEEMNAWLCPSVPAYACANGSAQQSSDGMTQAKIQWEATLSQLQRYLSCVAISIA